MVYHGEKLGNIGSVVGSKTANVKWIQGAQIPITYALERHWRLLIMLSWQIRGLSRWRYDRPGKQKTKLEITEDWGPCSTAA